ALKYTGLYVIAIAVACSEAPSKDDGGGGVKTEPTPTHYPTIVPTMPPKAQLLSFWSLARLDNFAGSTVQAKNDAGAASYSTERIEGCVFTAPYEDAVPLTLYYHDSATPTLIDAFL